MVPEIKTTAGGLRSAVRSVIILILSLFAVNTAHAQDKITFSSNKLTVQQAISEVEAQTKMRFGFSEDFKLDREISLNLQMSLENALSRIAGNDFKCVIQQRYIIISKKPKAKKQAVAVREPEPEPEKIFIPEAIWPVSIYEPRQLKFAVKTNVLYLATLTANIGVEFALSKKSSFEFKIGYNGVKSKSTATTSSRMIHWAILPGYRYWFTRSFEGAFAGIHGVYSKFNVERLPLIGRPDYRGDGYLAGVGVDIGYHWAIGKRWGLEASLGAGIIYLNYNKYMSGTGGALIGPVEKLTPAVTRTTISLVYFIK